MKNDSIIIPSESYEYNNTALENNINTININLTYSSIYYLLFGFWLLAFDYLFDIFFGFLHI
jgi:hypothetical protein